MNLLVRLLTVLVVWRIVRLLLGRTAPRTATGLSPTHLELAAGGGALLFAGHPIHVEAVAWVTGFKDVFGSFLSCVAVWQYLVYVRGSEDATAAGNAARDKAPRALGRYWLATGVFGLALLAKPSAGVVPVVAWVLDV